MEKGKTIAVLTYSSLSCCEATFIVRLFFGLLPACNHDVVNMNLMS